MWASVPAIEKMPGLRLARSRADLMAASARSASRTLVAMRTSSTSSATSGENRGGTSTRSASPRAQNPLVCLELVALGARQKHEQPNAGEHSKIARLCDVASVVLAGRVIASSHPIREEESMSTQTKQSINRRIT